MHRLFLAGVLIASATSAVGQTTAAPKKPVAPATKSAAPAPAAAKQAAPPAANAQSADAAVRAASAAYVAALNAGDLKAAAAFWSDGGEFVDAAGQVTPAATIVAERLPQRFAGKDRPQLKVAIRSLRLLGGDAALEDGAVETTAADGSTASRGSYSAVWVRRGGRWQIDSLREASSTADAMAADDLKQLDWLVGRWSAKADEATITVDCQWSEEHAWIQRDITIERAGQPPMRISQRIGRDPQTGRIKSWGFDSAGDTTEATWEPRGKEWLVSSHGTLPGGGQTSAENVYSDINEAGFTLTSQEPGSADKPADRLELKFVRLDGEAAAGSADANEEAQRAAILASPEWREALRAFQAYQSVQKTYTVEEMQEMNAALASKVSQMSAAELRDFLADSREKLAVLMSPRAQEARAWLAQRIAVEVKLTPEMIKAERPDIVNMTSAELEAFLDQWQKQREQVRQTQQQVEAGRAARVKNIQSTQKQQAAEREAALRRASDAMRTPYGVYYGPGPVNNPGRAFFDYGRRPPYYGAWRY
ncbi:MAG TPA: DUF4440 domain-containing protein [Pirellulales bacterium]|nr:DUF4440 domain-containing protein [Pirellulales bacterium]